MLRNSVTLPPDIANGNTVYQSHVSSLAAFPAITTPIAGLPDGTCNIWVFFWDNVGNANDLLQTGGLA